MPGRKCVKCERKVPAKLLKCPKCGKPLQRPEDKVKTIPPRRQWQKQ